MPNNKHHSMLQLLVIKLFHFFSLSLKTDSNSPTQILALSRCINKRINLFHKFCLPYYFSNNNQFFERILSLSFGPTDNDEAARSSTSQQRLSALRPPVGRLCSLAAPGGGGGVRRRAAGCSRSDCREFDNCCGQWWCSSSCSSPLTTE
jgi:hypothetical protein